MSQVYLDLTNKQTNFFLSFEVLAYADDLCVLCDGRNQLNNVIKIINKWSKLNGINVNKNKSGIMILKNDIKEKDNIDGLFRNTY